MAQEQTTVARAAPGAAPSSSRRPAWIAAALIALFAAVLVAPSPAGLPEAGKRVLAVAVLVIGLWCSELLPAGVTSLVLIAALVLSGGVPGFSQALAGFAEPVAYFLIGVLTIGLAVSRGGLAERIARFFLRRSRGNARSLYLQLLLAFPLLTIVLPSATTRTGILVHVYEHALEIAQVPRRSALASAIMMALNSINRLASTILLTGGITPVVAAALIGGVYWSQWLLLMSVPYVALLAIGSLLIYVVYRRGFEMTLPPLEESAATPLSARELRTVAITVAASALWLTDSIHHFHPVVPALLAWILLLTPRIGVLTWSEFERDIGWTNFFVLASSLSLAKALTASGASAWVAQLIVEAVPAFRGQPFLVVAILMVASVPVRLLIPNITGFLATTIPIAMSIGTLAGVNPLVCGLAVMIAGDAVLYYPAQSASSLAVYERGYLSAPEIFRFGIWMTIIAFVVVLAIALPYWRLVGEPLTIG
ncbi:MAG TPA: SLC13 family permease [Burkholderiales bacterium]|nr:SLC13 family permease [Burkholderiales bacterium]